MKNCPVNIMVLKTDVNTKSIKVLKLITTNQNIYKVQE